MKWPNNRSFYQVESIVKHHLCICPPEDEALFDDDDRSLSHVESDSSARRQPARLRGACGIAPRDGARCCGPSFLSSGVRIRAQRMSRTAASARAGNASRQHDQSRGINASFLGKYLSFDSCGARRRPGRRAATASPADHATVVAATKLPTVTDRPLLFRALSVTIPPKKQRLNRQRHSLPDVGIDRSLNR